MAEPQKVFVYGSLMKGNTLYNQLLANRAKFISTCTVPGVLIKLPSYPALYLDEHLSIVHGEVYEVAKHVMDELDYAEGTPANYQRFELTSPVLGNMWVYAFDNIRIRHLHQPMFMIPTGRWLGTHTNCLEWCGPKAGMVIGPPERPFPVLPYSPTESSWRLQPTLDGRLNVTNIRTGEIKKQFNYSNHWVEEVHKWSGVKSYKDANGETVVTVIPPNNTHTHPNNPLVPYGHGGGWPPTKTEPEDPVSILFDEIGEAVEGLEAAMD